MTTELYLPKGFYRLIWAQLISATADNALLLIAIALSIQNGIAAWWIPLLKVSYVVSYVVMAPWVGVLSDQFPKSAMMMISHMFKLLGSGLMLVFDDPRLGFALVGLGAALYSPAKYGWITENTPHSALVKANAWIETTSVTAAVVGVAWGGVLISEEWESIWTQYIWLGGANLRLAVLTILAMYSLTIVLMMKLPGKLCKYSDEKFNLIHLRSWIYGFVKDQTILWKDPLARISLAVTSLFWGVGACLQLLVLQWSQERFDLTISQSAYLQASTAVGVVFGALIAGRKIKLNHALRLLPLGFLVGVLILLMNWIENITTGLLYSITLGALCGFFIVPMNALLQHRGQQLITAGRSIAVQNFNENASILLILSLYSYLIHLNWAVSELVVANALWILSLMLTIYWHFHKLQKSKTLTIQA